MVFKCIGSRVLDGEAFGVTSRIREHLKVRMFSTVMKKPPLKRNYKARMRQDSSGEQANMDDVLSSRLGKRTFVSVSDVSSAVEVSVMTVLSWIKSKKIAVIDVSAGGERKHYRIVTASVLKFFKSRTRIP